jgi:hypothetical protein
MIFYECYLQKSLDAKKQRMIVLDRMGNRMKSTRGAVGISVPSSSGLVKAWKKMPKGSYSKSV